MGEGKDTEQWESRIIGMANPKCGVCKGCGRRNWLDQENARVQPCECVLYFDLERIRLATDEAMESETRTGNGRGKQHS